MKRTALTVVALALGAAASVAAQQPQGRSAAAAAGSSTTSVGPVVGLNYTTFYGSDAKGSDYRLGAMAGLQLDHDLGPAGTFRTGLAYSRRGAEFTDQGVTDRLLLSYIEIPLMLGYRFGTAGAMRPYLMGGGHVGFKVGCTLEETSGGVTASVSCDDPNVDANVSSTDVHVGAAAGLLFPGRASSFDVHLGYSLGLTKLVKDANSKNSGFTLAVAYLIPLGKR